MSDKDGKERHTKRGKTAVNRKQSEGYKGLRAEVLLERHVAKAQGSSTILVTRSGYWHAYLGNTDVLDF